MVRRVGFWKKLKKAGELFGKDALNVGKNILDNQWYSAITGTFDLFGKVKDHYGRVKSSGNLISHRIIDLEMKVPGKYNCTAIGDNITCKGGKNDLDFTIKFEEEPDYNSDHEKDNGYYSTKITAEKIPNIIEIKFESEIDIEDHGDKYISVIDSEDEIRTIEFENGIKSILPSGKKSLIILFK